MAVLAPPVQVVTANAPPFVHVPSGAPPFVATTGPAPPIMIVASGAPPITLFNEDGSIWVPGGAAAGGAALLVGEANGFATDFTYATDASRVAVKAANVTTNYAVDAFYAQAGTSPKMVYDASGVLGWSPHNYIASSNDFFSGWDAPTGLTMVKNATGPLGANTAWTLTLTAGTASKALFFNGPAGGDYRYSVYAKAGSLSWVAISDGQQPWQTGAYFNLSTGTVGTVAGRASAATMEAVGNGWYRCSITVTGTLGFYGVHPLSADGQSLGWTSVGGETLFVSACQANKGTVPTAYIPTTTAARFGLALDYDPVTHAARGLLVEKTATNLLLRSTDYADANWQIFSATKVGAAPGVPDPFGGTSTYELNVGTTAGANFDGASAIYQASLNFTSGVTYTLSWYLRAKTGTTTVRIGGGGATPGFNSGNITLTTAWQRFTFTWLETATATTNISIRSNTTGTSAAFYASHAQLEVGSVATSLIPTLAATVTRAADQISFLVSAIPAWTTEFSIYCRYSSHIVTTFHWGFCLTNGPGNDYVGYQTSGGAVLNLNGNDAGGSACQVLGPTVTAGTSYSAASRIKLNDCNMSVDGAAVGTPDTAVTVPTPLVYGCFGSDSSNAVTTQSYRIQKLMIVPRGWSNAELVTQSAVT